MRPRVLLLLLLAVVPAFAQNESRLARDFRVEGEALGSCTKFNFGSLTDCGQTLLMGQPLHIAVGSLAPQNGFGAGLAFVEHTDMANEWRLNWNADAVATGNGSWRAGGYLKGYRLAGGLPRPIFPVAGSASRRSITPLYSSAPLLNLYSETTSLQRVDFFGLGLHSLPATHTTFGMTENITGVSAIVPIGGSLSRAGLSVLAELNGRFPSVRPGSEASLPSTEQLFTESTAPGLTRQPAFVQPSEGLRLRPSLFQDSLRLNYLFQFQQFVAAGDRAYSFRRWNADFSHEIPLYRVLPGKLSSRYDKTRANSSRMQNGPDDCSASSSPGNTALPCPRLSSTQNLEGSITLRLMLSESLANAGSSVPFYLSPTLGGSDINGTSMLASYPDYRFRGPNLMLVRGTVEHSIGKLPIGALFSFDSGKVGLRRNDIAFDHLLHSFSAGVTVHAGGLPVVSLLFAWGGPEGHHTIANVSPTLLGGSARPSLF